MENEECLNWGMSETTHKPFVRIIHKTERHYSASYSVHGFWPRDSVKLYMSKDLDNPNEWDAPRIGWGSGGEDSDIEPDRIFAAQCFAAAIKNAAKLAKRWNALRLLNPKK